MEEFQGNSHKSKDLPEKKIEKVIAGTASTKKTSKFKEIFMQEDVKNVKSYILTDVLVPAIKGIISDSLTNAINMFLYGENARPRGKSYQSSNNSGVLSRISYRSYYDDPREAEKKRSASSLSDVIFDDIIVDSKKDVQIFLETMDDIIKMYGQASVSDAYEMAGMTAPYTGNRYGWTDFSRAHDVRLKDGRYLIKLHKASPIQTN